MTEPESTTPDPDASRKGNMLLLGALALVLIPVVIGWVMANRDSGSDASREQSGMGGSTSSAETSGFPVQPIETITDGDFVVEVDPSGTSAVLRLTTTVDVACSVVFGPTSDFGGLSVDDDMAGAGHSDHHPLMTGLEPGTTVLYRVQGTAADGFKVALALLHDALRGTGAGVVNLVHDEFVVETPESFADECRSIVVSCMDEGMTTFLPDVPVKVEATINRTWTK